MPCRVCRIGGRGLIGVARPVERQLRGGRHQLVLRLVGESGGRALARQPLREMGFVEQAAIADGLFERGRERRDRHLSRRHIGGGRR